MEIDKFKPKEPVKPEPYERREWVSAVLTFFGLGLPLIYCGRLKAGIIVEIISLILLFPIFFLIPVFPSAYIFWSIMIVLLIVFIAFLIFNVKLFRKFNEEHIPLFERAWIWVISIFLIMTVADEVLSISAKSFLVEAYNIPSSAMEKTLLAGDYLLADKSINSNDLDFGDLVIFKYPKDLEQNYIKRLIAKAGDRVRIENKQVYLNGEMLDEPYIQHLDSRIWPYMKKQNEWGPQCRDNMPEIIIPEGKFFVMGDSRDNSSDSRFWGFVDEELVKGKAMFIHFSWDSEDNRIRWDRIGTRLDKPSEADSE